MNLQLLFKIKLIALKWKIQDPQKKYKHRKFHIKKIICKYADNILRKNMPSEITP